ncbi:hypothetical protein [Spartinivicinus poritis]|uniref:Solute-binding protein family 3/N-terminal domain-containing protein n=1 Tax=Spartinivicinus poritis TaxID=2994640 RepID=A0ABT5UH89_9GAMM|nr:hypothetical protein [Spartinivicinus sp. A2-2]MDE1465761.1 hypothetical protein [Spartinivicinus sp. A2-2]
MLCCKSILSIWLLLLVLYVIASSSVSAKAVFLIRPHSAEQPLEDSFRYQLLDLVLSVTRKEFGDYSIKGYQGKISQDRVMDLISRGIKFRIIATMTSEKRENILQPIRIPLLKGLIGHRIFIIKAGEQAVYSGIQSLAELKKLRAIQGHDWPDTEILIANGFTVVTSPNYLGIFDMLQLNRADYFPRGVGEPWAEIVQHADKHLQVEEKIMLQYDAPYYFFVRKSDTSLYNRIKIGLQIIMASGQFDQLFYNYPDHQSMIHKANMAQRRLFRIENPFLKINPFKEGKYRYQPGEEKRFMHSTN